MGGFGTVYIGQEDLLEQVLEIANRGIDFPDHDGLFPALEVEDASSQVGSTRHR